MATDSKIEWTTHTFNPWRGCTKVSDGCKHCYAEQLSGRNPKTLGVWGPNGTRVVAAEAYWKEPLKWNAAVKCQFCGGLAACYGKYADSTEGYACDECCGHGCEDGWCETAEKHRPRVFCASLADVFEDWDGQLKMPNGQWATINRHMGKFTGYQGCNLGGGNDALTLADIRRRLFSLIDATPNLDWLLLTKRPENIGRMMPLPAMADCDHKRQTCEEVGCTERIRPNVWLGTSVENQQAADERITHLLRVPAKVRFISCEPLLGPVNLKELHGRHGSMYCSLRGIKTLNSTAIYDHPHIDWVIVGGESGPKARPMHPDWARSLRDQCVAAGVPYFFKQWGEWAPTNIGNSGHALYRFDGDGGSVVAKLGKKAAGRMLDGREWNEVPE